jgi:hypothetical protein
VSSLRSLHRARRGAATSLKLGADALAALTAAQPPPRSCAKLCLILRNYIHFKMAACASPFILF